MQLIGTRTQRARKGHVCSGCGEPILPGQTYRVQFIRDGGDTWNWKEHDLCADIGINLGDPWAYEDGGYDEGYIWELLRECEVADITKYDWGGVINAKAVLRMHRKVRTEAAARNDPLDKYHLSPVQRRVAVLMAAGCRVYADVGQFNDYPQHAWMTFPITAAHGSETVATNTLDALVRSGVLRIGSTVQQTPERSHYRSRAKYVEYIFATFAVERNVRTAAQMEIDSTLQELHVALNVAYTAGLEKDGKKKQQAEHYLQNTLEILRDRVPSI